MFKPYILVLPTTFVEGMPKGLHFLDRHHLRQPPRDSEITLLFANCWAGDKVWPQGAYPISFLTYPLRICGCGYISLNVADGIAEHNVHANSKIIDNNLSMFKYKLDEREAQGLEHIWRSFESGQETGNCIEDTFEDTFVGNWRLLYRSSITPLPRSARLGLAVHQADAVTVRACLSEGASRQYFDHIVMAAATECLECGFESHGGRIIQMVEDIFPNDAASTYKLFDDWNVPEKLLAAYREHQGRLAAEESHGVESVPISPARPRMI